MDQDTREYFQRREQYERAAAKKAHSVHARRVHQQLADNYATLIRSKAEPMRSDTIGGGSRLTIVA